MNPILSLSKRTGIGLFSDRTRPRRGGMLKGERMSQVQVTGIVQNDCMVFNKCVESRRRNLSYEESVRPV